jgi:hypothetical protein
MKIGFGKAVDLDFEAALLRVKEELQKQGFGVARNARDAGVGL